MCWFFVRHPHFGDVFIQKPPAEIPSCLRPSVVIHTLIPQSNYTYLDADVELIGVGGLVLVLLGADVELVGVDDVRDKRQPPQHSPPARRLT